MYSSLSLPIADLPDKKHVNCDQSDDDQHPVLAFESHKGEMLNEKMHRARPNFYRSLGRSGKKYIILYPLDRPGYLRLRPRELNPAPTMPQALSRVRNRMRRQQFVELGRIIAVAIGVGDEDPPTLFCQGSSPGYRGDGAQPERGRGIFTP